ncbi:transcriptional regulator [Enterobacterales bacterium CwR94]|nr:transcriptional regulator [Enterobacterales bacterium CwR94]
MKKLTGFLGAAVALAVLAGCSTYDKAESFVTQPVVKDVKKGMSRDQVRQIAGAPSTEITMVHARGTCQTYVLGQRDGKAQTYFVSYSDTGHVMNYGFQSCAEYDTDPQAPQK